MLHDTPLLLYYTHIRISYSIPQSYQHLIVYICMYVCIYMCYTDPAMLDDPTTEDYTNITLSYTFFKTGDEKEEVEKQRLEQEQLLKKV